MSSYTEVIRRSGGVCECRTKGCKSRGHGGARERHTGCDNTSGLEVAPAKFTPDRSLGRVTRMSADELRLWCPACLGHAMKAGQAEREAQERAQWPSLLDEVNEEAA